jgi:serine/threonine-protein kinase
MVALGSGSVIAGRYRLERLLAQGGMGAVWVARHLQLDVDVAVKLMRPAYVSSADARARFEREAKASAHLRSPHFVHVLDYGVEADAPFLVMELLEGEDLQSRLRSEPRLSLADTQRIVHQIARGLRVAHEAGLVHRDLKPANIFLSRQGNEEIVKVLDFGVAKVTGLEGSGAETATGVLLGSPQYMSPEQVRSSKELDRRSDLWSLGVIAFRCLTGQLPFQGEAVGDLIIEIWTEPIPRASSLVPDLDPAVDAFLERALRREPHLRFQTADEMDEAFAVVAGVPLGMTGAGAESSVARRVPPPVTPAATPDPVPVAAPQPALAPAPQSSPASFTPLVALTASDALTESFSRSAMSAQGVPMTALLAGLVASPVSPAPPSAPPPEGPSPAPAPEAAEAVAENTLTSTGQSFLVPPVRRGRGGLLVAGVLLAFGIVAGTLVFLGGRDDVAAPAPRPLADPGPPGVAGAQIAAVLDASTSNAGGVAVADTPAPPTSTAAAPASAKTPAVSRALPSSPPSPRAAPPKGPRPRVTNDDPLREM